MLSTRSLDPALAVVAVVVGGVGLVVFSVPEFLLFLALASGCGAGFALVMLVLRSRRPRSGLHSPIEHLPAAEVNFARLSVGGGIAGLLVVVGSVAVLTIGLEAARWFFTAALASGVLLAVVLVAWRRGHGGRQAPENRLKPRRSS